MFNPSDQGRSFTYHTFFHLENARGRYGCMKHSLCPNNSSMKDDSNDTKNETEKRILSFFLIGQSFLKIFAGAGAKLAGRRLALKELMTRWQRVRVLLGHLC